MFRKVQAYEDSTPRTKRQTDLQCVTELTSQAYNSYNHAWRGELMKNLLHNLWRENQGQDIAEYAVMLAVILVIVVGTIRLVGSQANNAFSAAASAIQ